MSKSKKQQSPKGRKKNNSKAKISSKSKKNFVGDILKNFKERWQHKSPVLLFALGFGLFMAVFYLISFTDFYKAYIFTPIVNANASIAGWILDLFGQDVVVEGKSLRLSDYSFAIDIKEGCDALEATALLWAGITSFPFAFKSKIPGYLLGTLFLLSMNLIRVITLFLVGVYGSEAFFETMHLDVWQAIFIILAVVSWVVWINWARKKQQKNSSNATE